MLENIIKHSYFTVILSIFAIIFITGCENDNDKVDFPQPESRKSVNGTLKSTIEIFLADSEIIDSAGIKHSLKTPTYEGTLIGPTLRINPGDTIDLNMINNFPQNPPQSRMGAFPHDRFTTNFHSHGLTVSPDGLSDNVFRKMEPGTENQVLINVPENHECGTFWYHPHKHGSVSFQFFGGMSGFLIIEGCENEIDFVPEVMAAKEVLMGFQVIRTDQDGNVPFVNLTAIQSGSAGAGTDGLWSTYQNSKFFITNNGFTNPTLRMKPGEVQRWRMLNAASGLTLPVALEGHELNIIALDGLTVSEVTALGEGEAVVMGAGNRVDVLIEAGEPGTYLLQALDPSTPRSVSISGVDPGSRESRVGLDFPAVTYPVTLASIIVEGPEVDMRIPDEPLPAADRLPSVTSLMTTKPDIKRNVVFEGCGKGGIQSSPEDRLPSCGWYFDLYDPEYWGGTEFNSLLMMRDLDDTGIPNDDVEMPLIDFQKEGLFDGDEPLFNNMIAGTMEEWTVYNRSFSDHPFHIHVNPFLLTHVNGEALPTPEWRDTILVPAATPLPQMGNALPINDPGITFGSVTFRTWFDPRFPGSFVMHCHILTHEDIGMMQRLDINPALEVLKK